MRKFLSFLIGTLIGVLVGGTVAILLAPSSGETLRGELRGRFGRFADELSDIVDSRRVELEGQLAELRK